MFFELYSFMLSYLAASIVFSDYRRAGSDVGIVLQHVGRDKDRANYVSVTTDDFDDFETLFSNLDTGNSRIIHNSFRSAY
jgi:hypothetical protein